MAEDLYDRDFPRLKLLGYRRTSEPADYNCIAFAVGDVERWWWPSGREDDYWPLPIPEKVTLQTFLDAFAARGYSSPIDTNGDLESGFEKIAVYALESGEVTHVAKQQEDGKWRSKLGPEEDIEHALDGLDGPKYGSVVRYLKRGLNKAP
jgi:hypothetical protein